MANHGCIVTSPGEEEEMVSGQRVSDASSREAAAARATSPYPATDDSAEMEADDSAEMEASATSTSQPPERVAGGAEELEAHGGLRGGVSLYRQRYGEGMRDESGRDSELDGGKVGGHVGGRQEEDDTDGRQAVASTIREWVFRDLWPRKKFTNETDTFGSDFSKKMLQELNVAPSQRRRFFESWSSLVKDKLNEKRNNVMGEMKKVFVRKYQRSWPDALGDHLVT